MHDPLATLPNLTIEAPTTGCVTFHGDGDGWRWMASILFSGVKTLEIRWVSVCACADVKWGFLHLPFISTITLQQLHTAFTTTFQQTTLNNEIKQGCITVPLNEEDNLPSATATATRTKAATILIIKHHTTSSSSPHTAIRTFPPCFSPLSGTTRPTEPKCSLYGSPFCPSAQLHLISQFSWQHLMC